MDSGSRNRPNRSDADIEVPVSTAQLPSDPLWPRASQWICDPTTLPSGKIADLALFGVPAHTTSITPTQAHTTPAAIRSALQRYSTYSASRGLDVSTLAGTRR